MHVYIGINRWLFQGVFIIYNEKSGKEKPELNIILFVRKSQEK